ncbi:flagellar protein FliT [Erwinia sp. Leaf53]|uniref:flagellar protein FliT n=1 Tax=Erwinia sp. Leaf53 TaxID=1736225 RepID=UPI0006FDCA27|nr:flagellar protein FliT [Erwinia sp. Leaf53]KQN62900.1 flagellar biosynthesis protein FliT [Erwinia sp. Leaf53]
MKLAPSLQQNYQHLLQLSQTMLRLANQGDWDTLVTEEAEYAATVKRIEAVTVVTPLTPVALQQLRPLLRHLLDNEIEIRRLVKRRQDELGQLMNNNTQQKNVLKAYGNMAGNVLMHPTASR